MFLKFLLEIIYDKLKEYLKVPECLFFKMKAEDVNVDLEELKKFKEQNAKERLEFIDFWVNHVKTHSDKEWSSQQKILIDSQISD